MYYPVRTAPHLAHKPGNIILEKERTEYSMDQNVMVNKRTGYRLPINKECFLLNDFFDIKSRTIDASKMGAGVLVANITTPFAKGDKVVVHIKSLRHISWAKISWIKKDSKNNSTRIGLKLHTTLGSELRLPKNL